MPDERSRSGSSGAGRVDLIDALVEFARQCPAWVRPDGLPLSWAHYVYGLDRLRIAKVRADLHDGQRQRVAFGADEQRWNDWQNERLRITEG